MAGSYNHAVADDGQLLSNEDFVMMVENLGDAYETVEEMYGMIWYLAHQIAHESGQEIADVVEDARKGFADGMDLSPGTDGALEDE